MSIESSTQEVRLLDFRARLSLPPDVLEQLRPLLPITPTWALTMEAPPATSLDVGRAATGGEYAVARDGAPVWTGGSDDVIPYLEWAVTAAAVEHLRAYYLVHAGAVAWEDRGVILPAASGSGKSSLTAKLIATGWRYLSDEVAVVDPRSGGLLPFAKSVHLHAGARAALQSAHPSLAELRPYRAPDGAETWYLPPRPAWLPTASVPLRLAIVPSFVPRARTELVPASPSTIFTCLLEQSFNLRLHGARGIGDLVRLVGDVACFTLTFGDLDEAARVLQEVLTIRSGEQG